MQEAAPHPGQAMPGLQGFEPEWLCGFIRRATYLRTYVRTYVPRTPRWPAGDRGPQLSPQLRFLKSEPQLSHQFYRVPANRDCVDIIVYVRAYVRTYADLRAFIRRRVLLTTTEQYAAEDPNFVQPNNTSKLVRMHGRERAPSAQHSRLVVQGIPELVYVASPSVVYIRSGMYVLLCFR